MTDFTPDLLDRIIAVAMPGETPEATIARALGKLEAPPLLHMGDTHYFAWAYPRVAKSMAVKMRAEGASWNQIRRALVEACGKAPSENNLRHLLPGWRRSLGAE